LISIINNRSSIYKCLNDCIIKNSNNLKNLLKELF
jgi:hypothetical protein